MVDIKFPPKPPPPPPAAAEQVTECTGDDEVTVFKVVTDEKLDQTFVP